MTLIHTATVKLSPRWIEHSPDTDRNGMMQCGKVPPRTPAAVIRSEAWVCPADLIGERHTHCAGCGRLVSSGDWDAKSIAEFTLGIGGPS